MITTDGMLDAWASAFWRASWQGGVAAMAAWLICYWIPAIPARFQSWLWRLVLVKFVVALVWAAPLELPLLPATIAPIAEVAASGPGESETAALLSNASSSIVEPKPIPRFSLLFVLFIAWIACCGFQAVRILRDYLAVCRLRNLCTPCEDNLAGEVLETGCKSTGWLSPPELLETPGQGSPLLIGIFRPAIVLPVATWSRLSVAERSLVIEHELAHAQRGDLFWSLFAAILRSLFCFHPLVWFSEQQLRLRQEIAADELAIANHRQDPVTYATLIVSVVGKLQTRQVIPAMSVGVEGSLRTLQQRFSAMRYMKSISRLGLLAYGSLLCLIALLGIVPWSVVNAQAPAPAKVPAAATETTPAKPPAVAVQPAAAAESAPAKVVEEKVQSGGGRGKFMSFQDGTLTIRANDGGLIRNKLSLENTKTFEWHDGGFQQVETVATLDRVKSGAWIHILIDKEAATIRIGARKAKTVGTFVSFKDNRLLILGKSLGESYVKKYGNQVHFNRFRADVEAYESVDGGEYQLVGLANKVLANVKEGTVITVHGEGDDNITLVQIGVPAQK